jgi:hypothetical protein
MAMTLPEIMEHMKDIDEITLIEVLRITSEDIVEQFKDRIEDDYDKFNREYGEEDE